MVQITYIYKIKEIMQKKGSDEADLEQERYLQTTTEKEQS